MKIFKTTSTRNRKYLSLLLALPVALAVTLSLSNFTLKGKEEKLRIVSVNGTTTEILCALGLESNLVGVDVTSTYPESVEKLPKVGHNRNISSEGVVALNPTLVIGTSNDLKPQLIEQLASAKVKTQLYKQDFSVEGTKALIKEIAATFHKDAAGAELVRQIDTDLAKVKKPSVKKKVLFIYARGAGTMMVAGKGTSVQKLIELAGGENAVNDFNDFKPLTAEALVAANPDVLLLFDTGLESIGGVDGLLQIQGIAQTTAGKNKKVIAMDGQLLTGFGPRLGKAVYTLSSQL